MDAERADRIRRNAANQIAVCKEFAQQKADSRIPISDEDWNAIEVLREPDHTVSRKRARTNYTWSSKGQVKRATKARIALEKKIKDAGMTMAEWRALSLPEPPRAKPKCVLIKKSSVSE